MNQPSSEQLYDDKETSNKILEKNQQKTEVFEVEVDESDDEEELNKTIISKLKTLGISQTDVFCYVDPVHEVNCRREDGLEARLHIKIPLVLPNSCVQGSLEVQGPTYYIQSLIYNINHTVEYTSIQG